MSADDTRSNLDPRKDDGNVGGNLIGESVGGASGIATGAALGSLGGPVGTVIGALAGAIGGWWSGRAISEAAASYTDHDDSHYRDHHTKTAGQSATRGYDDVRPAYQLGHLAGRNPDYAGRGFDEVEGDLQRGWTSDVSSRHGEWSSVRNHARDAYERGRGMGGSSMGGSSMGSSAMGGGSIGAAGAGLGDRIADRVDDMKDRVDGNPASRPGRDETDSPRR
jgi:hypothetical protein